MLMCRTLRGSTTAHGVTNTHTKKGTKFNPIRSYRYSTASFNAHEQKKEEVICVWKILIINQKTLTKLFLGNKWQIKGWGMNIKKYYIRCIFFVLSFFCILGLWGFFHVFVYLWVHYTVKMHTENLWGWNGSWICDIYIFYVLC